MQKEYKKLAKYFDIFYQSKDYKKESEFIIKLLKKYNAKSVLDVGCGTGNHIIILEKAGFECEGLDLNQEMLNIAKKKINAKLYREDICNFNLNRKYDAIICMFATFNHLTTIDSAIKAISCFYQHLNQKGILLIDLHNPSGEGSKVDEFGKIKRIMKWSYDKKSKIEQTKIKFIIPGGVIEDGHTLRVYSIEKIKKLLENVGFREINAYGDYGFKPAKKSSKNLEIIGIKNTKNLKGGA